MRSSRGRSGSDVELDALVIGGGPAGLGVGLALQLVKGMRFGIVERGRIGETFHQWPARGRFLTPSFTGNAFGAIDLNAVHPETSPAHTLREDYPSGTGYAAYLAKIAAHFDVPVRPRCGVLALERRSAEDGFIVHTSRGVLSARTVIWAGGEFGNPYRPQLRGRDLGVHSSRPAAWSPPEGAPVVVVGGYESGLDVACALVSDGHAVTVLDRGEPWETGGADPSLTLSPRSRQRRERARKSRRLKLVGRQEAVAIETADDGYVLRTRNRHFLTPAPPVLATGFRPNLGPVEDLFECRDDGWPLLTDEDESTATPGLFLAGPAVRHRNLHLCFIYKFRQRFAYVAKVIGDRLGMDTADLEAYRDVGMMVSDISCCDTDCAC